MTLNGFLQISIFIIIILACVKPLGWYMARVYEYKSCGLDKLFMPLENIIYRICGIDDKLEMNWKSYLSAMLIFNLFGLVLVYVLQRVQFYLPLNPQAFTAVAPDLAFNTAASFTTNTNWQAYSGESTLSYITQMLALTVQNFLSAATGLALLVAFIRGIIRRESNKLGNFWVDMLRSVIYILLPLALILAVALTSQGVLQNFKAYQTVQSIQSINYQEQVLDTSRQSVKDARGIP